MFHGTQILRLLGGLVLLLRIDLFGATAVYVQLGLLNMRSRGKKYPPTQNKLKENGIYPWENSAWTDERLKGGSKGPRGCFQFSMTRSKGIWYN